MREMKYSGIKWIGNIPKKWMLCKIKNVCSTIGSGTTPTSSNLEFYEDGTINWIQSGDLYRKSSVEECATQITAAALKVNKSLKVYQAPFIVIAMYGASIGNTAISKIDACVNQACCCFIPDTSTYLHYLYYWILYCKNDFFFQAQGGGQPNISQEKIKNQYFVKPPYEAQVKIADFLDNKCNQIDAIVSDIQKQIDTLEEYKRSVITEAVTKGLNPDAEMKDSGVEWIGEIPKHWELKKGKYIFVQRNQRGNNIELQLLSPTQRYGVIPQDLYEKISGYKAVKLDEKTDYSLLKTIHKGDYCISLRSFQGGFEYSEYEGVVSPAYQVFYAGTKIYECYYKYLFKTQIFIDKMNSFTMSLRDGKNIAFNDFGNTIIPVPSLEEQQQIAEYLDSKCTEIDSIISEKKKQIETIEEYKKSLIFEYVTGKKEVNFDE